MKETENITTLVKEKTSVAQTTTEATQSAQMNLTTNPLEGDDLLLERVFGGPAKPVTEHLRNRGRVTRQETKAEKTGRLLRERAVKPDHYKIVSISLYNEDIDRLNMMVDELKRRGHFKANKSMLIRHALEQIDLDQIPKNR